MHASPNATDHGRQAHARKLYAVDTVADQNESFTVKHSCKVHCTTSSAPSMLARLATQPLRKWKLSTETVSARALLPRTKQHAGTLKPCTTQSGSAQGSQQTVVCTITCPHLPFMLGKGKFSTALNLCLNPSMPISHTQDVVTSLRKATHVLQYKP